METIAMIVGGIVFIWILCGLFNFYIAMTDYWADESIKIRLLMSPVLFILGMILGPMSFYFMIKEEMENG